MSRPRRRTEVSLSSPEVSCDPVEQLDRAVEIIHRVTRGLPQATLSREELIAIAGLLTQISGAMLTFTEMLVAPAHHYGRIRTTGDGTDADAAHRSTAAELLRDCRNSYHAAGVSARAFHADIRR